MARRNFPWNHFLYSCSGCSSGVAPALVPPPCHLGCPEASPGGQGHPSASPRRGRSQCRPAACRRSLAPGGNSTSRHPQRSKLALDSSSMPSGNRAAAPPASSRPQGAGSRTKRRSSRADARASWRTVRSARFPQRRLPQRHCAGSLRTHRPALQRARARRRRRARARRRRRRSGYRSGPLR